MGEKNYKHKEYQVDGEHLVEKIKELIREGNVRRIMIRDKTGKTLIDLPLTLGVVGAFLAPQIAALGAVAALVSQATLVVEIADPES